MRRTLTALVAALILATAAGCGPVTSGDTGGGGVAIGGSGGTGGGGGDTTDSSPHHSDEVAGCTVYFGVNKDSSGEYFVSASKEGIGGQVSFNDLCTTDWWRVVFTWDGDLTGAGPFSRAEITSQPRKVTDADCARA